MKVPTGKLNIKIYNVNAKGSATIMISKVSDGELLHIKTLAFKVIKYILDSFTDGEIVDIDHFKRNTN